MIYYILFIVAVPAAIFIFMRSARFGSFPRGERLDLIKKSSNYKNHRFQNIHFTPQLAEGVSMFTVMRKFFFSKSKNGKPRTKIPARKTDLLHLPPDENILVWFGHSSYFIQIDGKRILVDPVFSGSASPISFTTKAFRGTDVYRVTDMPPIDYLFITHDHWDHLDYQTVLRLQPKVKQVITSFCVGAHLERWGYNPKCIIEGDWNATVKLSDGFIAHVVTARHFGGRTFKRDISLWSSFVLQTPTMTLFLGGDSGYDTHFAEIGNKYGPFDLVILENGQYNPYWKYIHMMPEEVVQAGIDLRAKAILPVHWGKFKLALHDWDEPIKRVITEAKKKGMPLLHPMIGEKLNLRKPGSFTAWWEDA